MAISDLMTRDVEIVGPDETLMAAARKMAARHVGFLPVCDGARIVGVITDRDIVVRALAKGYAADKPVRLFMSATVACCFDEDDIAVIAERMRHQNVRRMIVLDGDKRLAGVVALGDLARMQGGQAQEVLEQVSSAPANQ